MNKTTPNRHTEERIRDISEVVMPNLTEREFASELQTRGVRIVKHRGRYWQTGPLGFFHPVHWMARLKKEEATRPALHCWAFRAALREGESTANATLPLHIRNDVQGYGMHSLTSRQRNKLRNCRKKVEFVEVTAPDLLLEQGHALLVDSRDRTGWGEVPSPEVFRQEVENYFSNRGRLIIAGIVENRLAGYMTGHAVEGTAYIDRIYLSTEHLNTNVSLGLLFEWMEACRRAGDINHVVNGLHTPEDPNLCRYKKEVGFSIIEIPTKVWFSPLTQHVIKRYCPYLYYRLTGKKSEQIQTGLDQ
jgi:hypothetical protein